VVQEIFEENKSEKLRGAIIWTPMLATDRLEAANQREIKFSDPRVQRIGIKIESWGNCFRRL